MDILVGMVASAAQRAPPVVRGHQEWHGDGGAREDMPRALQVLQDAVAVELQAQGEPQQAQEPPLEPQEQRRAELVVLDSAEPPVRLVVVRPSELWIDTSGRSVAAGPTS